jgi:hypothetical protein
MSARAIKFLDQWQSNNLSSIVGADVISVAEAIEKLAASMKLSWMRSSITMAA